MTSCTVSPAVGILSCSQLKQFTRNAKLQLFFFLGSIGIFGIVLLAWMTTAGHERVYLSDRKFQKLSLDVQCDLQQEMNDNWTTTHCMPYYDQSDDNSLTTTDVFFELLGEGGPFGKSEREESQSTTSFITLLGNLMMNGLPLAGLDDYVFMSDFVNNNLDPKTLGELTSSPLLGGKFSNFLNVRSNEIRLVPDNCWTRGFADYLKETSSVAKSLRVKVFPSMAAAEKRNSGAWSVIEIVLSNGGKHDLDHVRCPIPHDSGQSTTRRYESFGADVISKRHGSSMPQPQVTLRFHPASIPDTRNLLWSQRKQGGGSPTTLQSGQLLYFTSGFLTIQYEIQNYFSFCGLGGIPIVRRKGDDKRRYSDNNGTDDGDRDGGVSSFSFLNDYLTAAILKSSSVDDLLEHLVNMSAAEVPEPSISVPLYDRAYPTRGYAKDLFWHNLGTVLSVALIIYFSVPAAMSAKEFSRNALKGHFDSLLTLPGITVKILSTSSVVSCCVLSLLPFALALALFSIIVKFTSPAIPAFALLVMSFSLGSIAVIISSLSKHVETAVVMVPTIVFLMTLPGMVYYDLAFDVQRTAFIECTLCLLSPTAAIIVLRSVCTMESLSLPLLLSTRSLVSNVPTFVHLLILMLDGVLYFGLALGCSSYQFQLSCRQYTTQHEACRGLLSSSVEGKKNRFVSFCKHVWHRTASVLGSCGGDNRRDVHRCEYEEVETVTPANCSQEQVEHYQGPYQRQSLLQNHLQQQQIDEDKPAIIGLVVSDVSKRFISTEKECQIEVLSHINATLHAGCVTTLLGSNGGGKTTLLRILGGFDSSYDGSIHYVKDADDRRRTVGWCSQVDALYDFLTVREHCNLFCDLLVAGGVSRASLPFATDGNTYASIGLESARTEEKECAVGSITSLLTQLDLFEHQDKYPSALSGGMKRRLSLCLAALGEPVILLLDEPTSGCDSFTREMVRQDILSRKNSCSVLISTHHIDDVEVISDRVWFLNDHSLVYDGPMSSLKKSLHVRMRQCYSDKNNTPGSGDCVTASHLDHVDFSTSNVLIRHLFLARFRSVSTPHLAVKSIDDMSGDEVDNQYHQQQQHQHQLQEHQHGQDGNNITWSVDLSSVFVKEEFRDFLKVDLEGGGWLDWSLSSPNVYDSLSRMYAPCFRDGDGDSDSDGDEWIDAGDGQYKLHSFPLVRRQILFCRNICQVFTLRIAEVKLKKWHFLFSSVILPFTMMLLLVFYCRDIQYPKMELTSSSIGGIGEILVSYGRQDLVESERSLAETVPKPLHDLFGDSLHWLGYGMKSNKVFDKLYKEYYSHSRDRWSSFVIDDTVEKWVQSSVRITDRSFGESLNMKDTFDTLVSLQRNVCSTVNSTSKVPKSFSLATTEAHGDTEKTTPNLVAKTQAAFDSSLLQDQSGMRNISDFCKFMSSMHIDLVNSSSPSDSKRGRAGNSTRELVMLVSQSMKAKVTILSNMTFFHDTPMFLKEVLPYVYSSRDETCSESLMSSHESYEKMKNNMTIDATTSRNRPTYSLFSHPFDDSMSKKKSISPAFIQRGYLGSVIVVMFILLSSTSSVNFITQCKAGGIKTQLHLSGVSAAEYWMANFLVDSGLTFLSFFVIFLATSIGGPPISSFYLDVKSENAHVFLFSLCTFATSSVASNYFFAFLSVDQVSSQLLALFSSLCGGLFLRLFVALHSRVEPYITLHHFCLWLSPPYAFSSNMYTLFVQYARHFNPKMSSAMASETEAAVSLFTPLVAMCLQSVVYLILTIVADFYCYRLTCWVHRLTEKVTQKISKCREDSRWKRLTRNDSISLRETVWKYISLSKSGKSETYSEVKSSNKSWSDHRSGCSDDDKCLDGNNERWYDEERALLLSSLSQSSTPSDDLSTLEQSSNFLSGGSPDYSPSPTAQTEPDTHRVLSAVDLHVAYPTGFLTHSHPAVKDLTVHINQAERVALMGVNGGGKSTLFRSMISTDLLPVNGLLSVGEHDTVADHWAIGKGHVVGYVPQEGGLVEFMTVQAAVDMFMNIRRTTILASMSVDESSPASGHQQHWLLKEKKMRGNMYSILPKRYFPYYVFSLSGGNKQKLAILLSNIFDPALLLLDEPTSGIDPPAAHELIRYLTTLPPSQAMIFASHRMEECLIICRRVVMLYAGRIQFDGPVNDFSKVTDLFYQVDVEIEERSDEVGQFSHTAPPSPGEMTNFVQKFQAKVASTLLVSGILADDTDMSGHDLFERVVRYSNELVRFTFEKTKCPVSVVWSVVSDWGVGDAVDLASPQSSCSQRSSHHKQSYNSTGTTAPLHSSAKAVAIKSMSLRKMSMEEIFAAMVHSARSSRGTGE